VASDQDDFLDDEEQEDYAPRSIFSAGWFRAVLVLTVLAIVVVVSLPYVLNWFEPAPTPPKTASRPVKPPTPPAPSEPPSALIPAPGGIPAAPSTTAAPASPAATPPTAQTKPPEPPPAQARAPAASPSKPMLQPPAARRQALATPKPETRQPPAAVGDYFVQVGLFKDPKNAEGLARALRNEGFPVEVARVTRTAARMGAAQQHEIVVTGASVEQVNAALKGRGSAQATPGGVLVRPALDLKEATALSKELAAEGLKVTIRRVGESAEGGTFHVVRVGGFPDRARAVAARDELSGKGHAGFLTRGPAK
jgi:cell division septation protein DedD